MKTTKYSSVTDKNLDRLAGLLSRELASPSLTDQIPDSAHIFHGSHSDASLTQENLKLVGKILLGMTLGYVEEAPLIMVYEYKPGKHTAIDFSTPTQKDTAQEFIESFQERSQQNLTARLNELLVA